MALDIGVFAIYLGIGFLLGIVGLAEKKYWPLAFLGGVFLIVLSANFGADPTIDVAYQATGTAITYTLTPLMVFVFGLAGFLMVAIGSLQRTGWL